jgi:hypothetical protein
MNTKIFAQCLIGIGFIWVGYIAIGMYQHGLYPWQYRAVQCPEVVPVPPVEPLPKGCEAIRAGG